ncbi:50S ribosomal protein L18 [Candidatus Woesearchaeota archaeon]|nr:50S ribosomal protein L18 [Candidatus Woesearchaeota archaeon]
MTKQIRVVQKRRRREGRTNYHKRLKLLLGKTPRIIIRLSTNNVVVQLAKFNEKGDAILATVNSCVLEQYGWKFKKNNLPACYLAGLSLGKKAKEQGITHAIADIGLHTSIKGSKIYAVVKGLLDAGLSVPVSKEILPSDDRIQGKHIATYFAQNKNEQQFHAYKQQQLNAGTISTIFAEVKKKILG